MTDGEVNRPVYREDRQVAKNVPKHRQVGSGVTEVSSSALEVPNVHVKDEALNCPRRIKSS